MYMRALTDKLSRAGAHLSAPEARAVPVPLTAWLAAPLAAQEAPLAPPQLCNALIEHTQCATGMTCVCASLHR